MLAVGFGLRNITFFRVLGREVPHLLWVLMSKACVFRVPIIRSPVTDVTNLL